MKELNCYRVKVNCTNSSNNTFFVPNDKNKIHDSFGINEGQYLSCRETYCYVITDDAAKIYQEFGNKVVVSVEKIGIGYIK